MSQRVFCLNGACRVNNERAEHCPMFYSKISQQCVYTCGSCVNGRRINSDGSIPDAVIEELEEYQESKVFV